MEFWTLAAYSLWNEDALHDMFIKGLNEQLKDELANSDLSPDLKPVVNVAIVE